MVLDVVVLGSGYAGSAAVVRLQRLLGSDAHLTWVSDVDYHFVLHESHRMISHDAAEGALTIPISDIASDGTTFVHDRVDDVDLEAQEIVLASGGRKPYDYLVIAIGSETAFFGIPGLKGQAITLKSRSDANTLRRKVREIADDATRSDPGRVVVGGGGLSGIQIAGEIAQFRDEANAPIDVHLVEALDEIYPGRDPSVQRRLRDRLEAMEITVHTDAPITEATDTGIYIDGDRQLEYDTLVWAGGITGRKTFTESELDTRYNRIETDWTLSSSHPGVFAIGDAAFIDGGTDEIPPTAQAAWQAADHVSRNIERAISGKQLRPWSFTDKGTVISIGESAVAHDVPLSPVDPFGGTPARTLKKLIAARWIAHLTSWRRARRAWDVL